MTNVSCTNCQVGEGVSTTSIANYNLLNQEAVCIYQYRFLGLNINDFKNQLSHIWSGCSQFSDLQSQINTQPATGSKRDLQMTDMAGSGDLNGTNASANSTPNLTNQVFVNDTEFTCTQTCSNLSDVNCTSCNLTDANADVSNITNMTEANFEAACLFQFANSDVNSEIGSQISSLVQGTGNDTNGSSLFSSWSGCLLLQGFQNQLANQQNNQAVGGNTLPAQTSNNTNNSSRLLRGL